MTTTPSTSTAVRGETVTFTITVKNNGPAALSVVHVSLGVPQGTESIVAPTTGDNQTCSNICHLHHLGSGESRTIRQHLTITGAVSTVVHRTSPLPSTETPDPNPSNDVGIATVTVKNVRNRAARP